MRRLLPVLLVIFMTWLPLPEPVLAETTPFRTFYTRPDGDDANDGLSRETAFQSVHHAVKRAKAGDTVIVCDGVYTEYLTVEIIDKQGTAEHPFVLRAENRGKAVVRSHAAYNVVNVYNSAHVVVEGLDVSFEKPSQYYGILVENCNHVVIRNNITHGAGSSGIQANGSDNVLIEGNISYGNAMLNPNNGSGISSYEPVQRDDSPGPGIVIRNNIVFNNECRLPFAGGNVPTDGNGIIIDDFRWTQKSGYPPYTKGALVENNVCFNNGGAGVHVFLSDHVTVRNNTTWHNTYIVREHHVRVGEISVVQSAHVSVSNNLAIPAEEGVFSMRVESADAFEAAGNVLAGSVHVQSDSLPLFGKDNAKGNQVLPHGSDGRIAFRSASKSPYRADFSVKDGSVAIDAGIASLAPADDLVGNVRPVGEAPDAGAIEHGGERGWVSLKSYYTPSDMTDEIKAFRTNAKAGDILGFHMDGKPLDLLYQDIHLCRYLSVKDLSLTDMHLQTGGTDGRIRCAVYSDENGQPGELLRESEEKKGIPEGWSSFALASPLDVHAEAVYWLAVWMEKGDAAYGYGLPQENGGLIVPAVYEGVWPNRLEGTERLDATFAFYAAGRRLVPSPTVSLSPEGTVSDNRQEEAVREAEHMVETGRKPQRTGLAGVPFSILPMIGVLVLVAGGLLVGARMRSKKR